MVTVEILKNVSDRTRRWYLLDGVLTRQAAPRGAGRSSYPIGPFHNVTSSPGRRPRYRALTVGSTPMSLARFAPMIAFWSVSGSVSSSSMNVTGSNMPSGCG
jgi:hypothetical protein